MGADQNIATAFGLIDGGSQIRRRKAAQSQLDRTNQAFVEKSQKNRRASPPGGRGARAAISSSGEALDAWTRYRIAIGSRRKCKKCVPNVVHRRILAGPDDQRIVVAKSSENWSYRRPAARHKPKTSAAIGPYDFAKIIRGRENELRNRGAQSSPRRVRSPADKDSRVRRSSPRDKNWPESD